MRLTQSQQSQRSFSRAVSSAPTVLRLSRVSGRHGAPADEARAGVGVPGTGEGWKRGRGPSEILWGFVDFVAGAADHVGGGEHSIHRTGTVSGGAKRRVSIGVGCGRGPSAFLREAQMPPERPGSQPSPIPAARSRGVPDRTNDGGNVPVRRMHRRSRQLNGEAGSEKDAQQVEASAGCSAYTAEKVSAEDAAILTVAGACDGTAAGLAARRTRRLACNQICDEPNSLFLERCVAGIVSGAHWKKPPGHLMRDLENPFANFMAEAGAQQSQKTSSSSPDSA
jgi:hypothetical protein